MSCRRHSVFCEFVPEIWWKKKKFPSTFSLESADREQTCPRWDDMSEWLIANQKIWNEVWPGSITLSNKSGLWQTGYKSMWSPHWNLEDLCSDLIAAVWWYSMPVLDHRPLVRMFFVFHGFGFWEMLNRRDPRKEPWGTPTVIHVGYELLFPIIPKWSLTFKSQTAPVYSLTSNILDHDWDPVNLRWRDFCVWAALRQP